jgi:hypothetical protein
VPEPDGVATAMRRQEPQRRTAPGAQVAPAGRPGRLHRSDHAGAWFHDFDVGPLGTRWARDATPETVHAGRRPIKVVRVRITDAGRLALAG